MLIPAFITVHMGAHGQNAPDVRVSFIDYTKNAASCELYPFWPEAALSANICSIVSYTLCVVSEKPGLNAYDITNVFPDPCFVPGREIFSTIAALVDRQFTECITKDGVNPFKARWCNGISVAGAGLSRWGSVGLAAEGFSAAEILAYYFGETQILHCTPKGIPEFPDALSSADILHLQNCLNRVSTRFPGIPKVLPDGVSDISDAVSEFRRVFHMPGTELDRALWYRLSLEGAPEERPAAECICLVPGSVDYEVTVLHTMLTKAGFPCEGGVFSPATAIAVSAFQRRYLLPESGIADCRTWECLRSVCADIDAATFRHKGQFPAVWDAEAVTELQAMLNVLSLSYHTPGVQCDGIDGPETKNAVFSGRRLLGLGEGGADFALWRALCTLSSQLEFSPRSPRLFPKGAVFSRGDRADCIAAAQIMINAVARGTQCQVTGVLDACTLSALKRLDAVFGLPFDGLDYPAWVRLCSLYESMTVSG